MLTANLGSRETLTARPRTAVFLIERVEPEYPLFLALQSRMRHLPAGRFRYGSLSLTIYNLAATRLPSPGLQPVG